jgi:hypothetical protein
MLTEPRLVNVQVIEQIYQVEIPSDRQMRVLAGFVYRGQKDTDTAVHGIPP